MRHGSLFNGIGGFQLAAHWMGWENVWHVEIDKFCNKVVKQHFPNSICYEDIKNFDGTEWRGKIDIISGGFPCQPFSQAGKRKGTDDNRYLWPEMLRVIREIQPRFIVGENVSGLINWDRGMVFEQVQADLETAGYESQAYVLPACGINAPHRRDRVWFIANAKSMGRGNGIAENKGEATRKKHSLGDQASLCAQQSTSDTTTQRERSGSDEQGEDDTGRQQLEGTEPGSHDYHYGFGGNAADTNGNERRKGRMHTPGRETTERYTGSCSTWNDRGTWENFPTQSPVYRRDDGIPDRVDRIKALGNAIVPNLAYEIFKAIAATPCPGTEQ
jgi:DNA (cytosine-5)-methyltransferase 1